MEQITGITIKNISLSGFRNQERPIAFSFGPLTCVSGHNGVGKTTIAHAVCFALFGVNFYGEQKIEHLRHSGSNSCEVVLSFYDQNGNEHSLCRKREGAKTDLYFDNYTVRQEDINRFVCDKETFLCLFNPTYLTECSGVKGRDLLLKNLKTVTSEQVLSAMSDSFRKPLEGLTVTEPSEMLAGYRTAIRKSEEEQRILEARIATLEETERTNEAECQKLAEKAEESAATAAILKEKQFGELDLDDFRIRRKLLCEKLKEAPSDSSAAKTAAIDEKLKAARERQYVSKFTEPLAELTAEMNNLSDRYNVLKTRIGNLTVGSACPTCLMRITEDNISQIRENLKTELSDVVKKGKGLAAAKAEMLETDRKSRETFEQFRKDDIAALSEESDELRRSQAEAATPDIIQKEIEEIDLLLTRGLLSAEDFDELRLAERQTAEYEAQIKKLREYSITDKTAELLSRIKELEDERRQYTDVVASLQEYVEKRTELATSVLQMPHTKIALFEPVKSTGEVKSVFRFDYNGYPYVSLSLSEKMMAGLEITAMLRRITGLSFPVCIDNTESIAVFAPESLPHQTVMLRMIKGKPLTVQAVGSAKEDKALPKAG